MTLDTTGDRKLGPLPLAMLWLQSIQTQKMILYLEIISDGVPTV